MIREYKQWKLEVLEPNAYRDHYLGRIIGVGYWAEAKSEEEILSDLHTWIDRREYDDEDE